MENDDSFTYTPEVEATYTDEETDEAMEFLKKQNLPMTELYYALQYIRIAHRAVEYDEQMDDLRKRLKKLRDESIPSVGPPTPDELN